MIQKREKGITLIALVVTIITLIIISGITIGTLQNKSSTIKQARETGNEAGKESIIEKIEADLYQEKTKTGKLPTKNEMKTLISNKGYNKGELGEDSFVTKDGEYTISYQDISGWKSDNGQIYKNYFNYNDIFKASDNWNLNNGTKCDDDGWISMSYDNTNGTSTQYCNYFTNASDMIKTNNAYYIVLEIKYASGNGYLKIASTQTESDSGAKPQFDGCDPIKFSDLKTRRYICN